MPMDMKCNMANELCGIGGSVKNGAERVNALSNYAPSGMTVVSSRSPVDQNRWDHTDLPQQLASDLALKNYCYYSVFVQL